MSELGRACCFHGQTGESLALLMVEVVVVAVVMVVCVCARAHMRTCTLAHAQSS